MISVLSGSTAISVAILNSFNYYSGEELAETRGQDDENVAGLQLTSRLRIHLTVQ